MLACRVGSGWVGLARVSVWFRVLWGGFRFGSGIV